MPGAWCWRDVAPRIAAKKELKGKQRNADHKTHSTSRHRRPRRREPGDGEPGDRQGTSAVAQQADHHRGQFPAGGLADGIARAFAQHVQQGTGQQVMIDNKTGAGGNIGAALVARAPADGHTFLHSVSGTLIQNP